MTIYNNNKKIQETQCHAVRFLTAILLLSCAFILDQPPLCYASSDEVAAKQGQFDNQNNPIMSKLVGDIPAKDIDPTSLTFEHLYDYSLLWKSLGVIGIFVIFILIWNRQLVKLNRKITEAHHELEVKSRELERLSVTDPLTGLYNRRYIETKLLAEIKRHTRHKHNLSIIIIDLDDFKQVNDTYGHQTGDTVLRNFSNMLKTGIRESDVASRWGGEEFLIICPENDLRGASIQAENIRSKLNKISFAIAGRQTASFGVACYEPGESGDNLVRRADDALYIAKNSGRNRIEAA